MKIVKYILSVAFIMASFGAIFQGKLLGALFIALLGIVLLPTVSEKLAQKFSFWKNKFVRYGSYLGLFILMGISSNSKKETVKTDIVIKETKINKDIEVSKSTGLETVSPADIYPNFEDKGFTITKEISTDGSFFHCDKEDTGIKYEVKIYCEKNVNEITSIRLTANRNQADLNDVEDMKPFLKYSATIPYDGADIEKVKTFIEKNYNNDKASIVISGVKFIIYCPTEFTRMITIGE